MVTAVVIVIARVSFHCCSLMLYLLSVLVVCVVNIAAVVVFFFVVSVIVVVVVSIDEIAVSFVFVAVQLFALRSMLLSRLSVLFSSLFSSE